MTEFTDETRQKLVPVRVGRGKKIHAATFEEQKRGRMTHRTHRHICGAGESSFAHSFHVPSVRPALGAVLDDVNCSKCLTTIRRHESGEMKAY